MSLVGLKGSGFIISVSISLLLSGLIVYYIKQKMDQNDLKMQNMLNLIQQMNIVNARAPPPPNAVPYTGGNSNGSNNNSSNINSSEKNNSNNHDSILETNEQDSNAKCPVVITTVEDDLIDVSDNDSEISCTTDDENDDGDGDDDGNDDLLEVIEDSKDDGNLDVEDDKVEDISSIIVDELDDINLDTLGDNIQDIITMANEHANHDGTIRSNDADAEDDDDDADADDDDDTDDEGDDILAKDVESTKSIQLTGLENTDEDAELDNILMNQLSLAKEKTQVVQQTKYADTKLSDLRGLIKDNMSTLTSKGVKVQNVSKLKYCKNGTL